MGITDAFTRFSDSQDLAGTIDGEVVSNSSIKLSESTSRLRDVGAGEPIRVRFYVNSIITGATSVAFKVILASNSTLSSNVLTLASSGPVLIADLTTGASFDVLFGSVPTTLGDGLLRQYLGASYLVVGEVTVGLVSASIVTDTVAPKRRAFVSGYTGP
jgi:hypothetical protein